MLHQCRLKAIWTASRRAKAKFIPKVYVADRCPFCDGEGMAENIGHMLLYCSGWADQRNAFMSSVIKAAEREVHLLFRRGVYCVNGDQLKVVMILGGSFLDSNLESWLPTISHPLGCGLFQVARFLQSIEYGRIVGFDNIRASGEITNGANAPVVRQHRAGLKRSTPPH